MTTDIATIMVPVEPDHPSDKQIQNVGALAAELGARLIGITAGERAPAFYFEAGIVAQELLEGDVARLKQRMAEAEGRFRKGLAGADVPVEWRSAVGIPLDFVIRESRAADLLVCFFRRNPTAYSDVEPGALVLKSGRPLLVLPEAAKWRSPARILIIWKDAREARRAVLDALPFLLRAKEVAVVEIAEGQESPRAADARLCDVVAWLQAHEIKASRKSIKPKKSVMDEIDAAARDFDADLIVAGAYGRSRLGEWIFGGVTRHLLTKPRRAVFLSH